MRKYNISSVLNGYIIGRKLIPMNRIKEVLHEKGIKQTWLSEKLGKSYTQVNAYVQNRSQPSLEVLLQISALLNTDVRLLIQSNLEEEK